MDKEKILAECEWYEYFDGHGHLAIRMERLEQILTAQEGKCPECGGVNEAGDNSPCPVCTAQEGEPRYLDRFIAPLSERQKNQIAKRKIEEYIKEHNIPDYAEMYHALHRIIDWLDKQEDK